MWPLRFIKNFCNSAFGIYFIGVSTPAEFAQGAYLTFLEINASNIAPRAAQLAGEIALNQPALVGLQEVTLWRKGLFNLSTTPPSATMVLYDQLNLLLTDLANHYTAVAVQTLTDVEVPVPRAGLNVRFTDQNVVLVRTDLMGQLALSNIQLSPENASRIARPSASLNRFGDPWNWAVHARESGEAWKKLSFASRKPARRFRLWAGSAHW
jgi:hypothetical protein